MIITLGIIIKYLKCKPLVYLRAQHALQKNKLNQTNPNKNSI